MKGKGEWMAKRGGESERTDQLPFPAPPFFVLLGSSPAWPDLAK
jgi:hypothetical protein